jgi:hypothetical protein
LARRPTLCDVGEDKKIRAAGGEERREGVGAQERRRHFARENNEL